MMNNLTPIRPMQYCRPKSCHRCLQLNIVVEQPDLFARLESGQADIRAAVTSEGVAQSTVAAAADLTFDSEVDLSKVIGTQLQSLQTLVGLGALGVIFLLDLLLETARAVLAGASAFAIGLARLGW